ncbi:tripartite tricarboxylate transporter substrate-binding protein [Siccirubricoccus deserti]
MAAEPPGAHHRALPAGGATDMLARLVAQGLGNRLGQPLVVENRPGGVGVVATQNLLGAPADGHALIFATCDTHTIMPAANPGCRTMPRNSCR